MARIGLPKHRKFRDLARRLGSAVIARGSLELVWDASYETIDPVIGTATDVEELACWRGKKGVLAEALCAAGFLDRRGDGVFVVHDYWDHVPEYVTKRAKRQRIGPFASPNGGHMADERPTNGGHMASSTDGVGCQTDARDVTGRDVTGRDAPPTPTEGGASGLVEVPTRRGLVRLTTEQQHVVERFAMEWPSFVLRVTGARGRFRPALDHEAVCDLVAAYPEDRIWLMAEVMLRSESLNGKVRNPVLLAELAPELDRHLVERGR